MLTNNHVVDGARYIEVCHPAFSEKFQATIERILPALDAALLSLEESAIETLFCSRQCAPLPLADSSKLKTGESVAIIGYPLGYSEPKIAEGVLSGCKTCNASYSQFTLTGTLLSLQISCSTNPGNSGGPCLNKKGEVIGMVSSGIEKTGDHIVSGINFCVPINNIHDLWNKRISSKILKISGLEMPVQMTNQRLRNHLGFEGKGGMFVQGVLKNSVAEKAGLEEGDLLYSINNLAIDKKGCIFHPDFEQNVELLSYYCSLPHESLCTLGIVRKGKKIELSHFIDRVSASYFLDIVDPFIEPEKIEYEIIGGAVCIPFLVNVCSENYFATKLIQQGLVTKPQVIIINVLSNSPATDAYIKWGGIISEVNGKSIETMHHLREALKLSVQTGEVIIKTEEKESYVLSLEEIKNSERKIASLHNYQTTPFMKELLENYKK